MRQLAQICLMPLWWKKTFAAVLNYRTSIQILLPSTIRSQRIRSIFANLFRKLLCKLSQDVSQDENNGYLSSQKNLQRNLQRKHNSGNFVFLVGKVTMAAILIATFRILFSGNVRFAENLPFFEEYAREPDWLYLEFCRFPWEHHVQGVRLEVPSEHFINLLERYHNPSRFPDLGVTAQIIRGDDSRLTPRRWEYYSMLCQQYRYLQLYRMAIGRRYTFYTLQDSSLADGYLDRSREAAEILKIVTDKDKSVNAIHRLWLHHFESIEGRIHSSLSHPSWRSFYHSWGTTKKPSDLFLRAIALGPEKPSAIFLRQIALGLEKSSALFLRKIALGEDEQDLSFFR